MHNTSKKYRTTNLHMFHVQTCVQDKIIKKRTTTSSKISGGKPADSNVMNGAGTSSPCAKLPALNRISNELKDNIVIVIEESLDCKIN